MEIQSSVLIFVMELDLFQCDIESTIIDELRDSGQSLEFRIEIYQIHKPISTKYEKYIANIQKIVSAEVKPAFPIGHDELALYSFWIAEKRIHSELLEDDNIDRLKDKAIQNILKLYGVDYE